MARMQALVIRTSGDAAISSQIVRGLESRELTMLRAELKVLRKRDNAAWGRKLEAARRKYDRVIRPHSKLYNALWGAIGMLVELRREAKAGAQT